MTGRLTLIKSEFKRSLETLEEGHRFLTPVCWDLV